MNLSRVRPPFRRRDPLLSGPPTPHDRRNLLRSTRMAALCLCLAALVTGAYAEDV